MLLSGPSVECEGPNLRGIKVLVVEDEADARELVRRYLVECEALPAVAASAAEAQKLLLTFKPDVIVSDIGMPQKDGYEFIRDVRKQGLMTPAVALSAYARAEDRIRSAQTGYQTHLAKPVEPAELLAVIASLAGRYERTAQESFMFSIATINLGRRAHPDSIEPAETNGGHLHGRVEGDAAQALRKSNSESSWV
jgi:DNA-binding response OmpR family regulator